ncbi:NAD(P)-dependent oxidoreductase [Pseudonocardia sp. TRM90224]|uniref:NAD(P)-dependent oxidoreductase n=1 Tax=Pseudonocardia sp. TRM90224 TaxID=2812678 RepID=UPI001E4376F0|nr:NAD(P)-dependent oxidoreductase [Pseudonocardia sp. TRM90224]
MSINIGFVGVGRMGLPMCANLVAAGHDVVAHDLRPDVADAARRSGARWAGDVAAAVADADVVITMLPGPPEVEQAAAGIVAAMRPGTTWIEMSSSSPAAGTTIRTLAAERGVDVLEAPVGGGPAAARDGTLRLFVGGTAELLARHRPVLEVLADPTQIRHVGGAGAGYTTKLLVNLLWFGQAVATAEALLLGKRAGIDLQVLREAIGSSAASSEFVRRDLDALFAGDYLRSFGLDRCCEELGSITALAREHDVPFALSELVEDVHRRALERFGPVDGELLAVALLEQETGVELR